MQNVCFNQFIVHIFVKQNRNTMTEKQFKELLFNLRHLDGLSLSSKTRDYYLVFWLNLNEGLINIESLEFKTKKGWDISEYEFTADQEMQLYKSAIELKQNTDYQIKCNEDEYNERWK